MSSDEEMIELIPGQNTIVKFGQYKGLTYMDIVNNHPDYVVWGLQEKRPAQFLQTFLTWATHYFVVDSENKTLTRKPNVQQLGTPGKPYEPPVRKRVSKLASLVPNPKGPCPDGCPQ